MIFRSMDLYTARECLQSDICIPDLFLVSVTWCQIWVRIVSSELSVWPFHRKYHNKMIIYLKLNRERLLLEYLFVNCPPLYPTLNVEIPLEVRSVTEEQICYSH